MNGAQGTSKGLVMRRSQQVMYDFHARHGIRAQPGQGKYKDGRRHLRWRFATLTDAEKFARQFGGSLVARR